jgi:N-methylhydantoinase B/oxoprolinase/acetone carboxylase alpha subunit
MPAIRARLPAALPRSRSASWKRCSARWEAIPERLFAAPAGTSGNFGLGGYDPEENRHYIMYLFSGGGYGGWWQTDGLTNGCSSVGISKTQPVEILERHYPILFDRFALRGGSRGAGRHRGGLGSTTRSGCCAARRKPRWRFLETGGPVMLRMMNRPANHGHAQHHAH